MILFAIIPLIALLELFLICEIYFDDFRRSLLSALVAWGVTLVAITEILNFVNSLSFLSLLIVWLLISLLLFWFWRRQEKHHFRQQDGLPHRYFSKRFLPKSSSTIFLLGLITFYVVMIGLIAVVAAPNHSDSMEYHLSRVFYWIQQGSVAHYPTHNLFQLYQNPWSEFTIMHFQILSGGDRFAGLVQWGSMVGSVIGISLITKKFGTNLNGQILSAIFCVTIPMGILQGSSTNNDYVLSLWLVCFVYFAFERLRNDGYFINTIFLGLSLGLAILTKGSAYILVFPFCLWIFLSEAVRLRWGVFKPMMIAIALVLALNFGHYTRNLLVFSSVLGNPSAESNQVFGLKFLISNITRNLALHADIVRNLWLDKFINPLTGIVNRVLEILHNLMGLKLSDPRITSPKINKFFVPGLSYYEDTAGNPMHLLIIMVSCLLTWGRAALRKQPYVAIYCFNLCFAFILFCALISWSPYRTRLHLPLFVLFSAVVGFAFSKSCNRVIVTSLASILILLSLPWIFLNETRPLVGENNIFTVSREAMYFNTKPKWYRPFKEAAELVTAQQCNRVGLMFNNSSFEYPLFQFFRLNQLQGPVLHVNVENESNAVTSRLDTAPPCAVIAIGRATEIEDSQATDNAQIITVKEQSYAKSWESDVVKVFFPSNTQ